MIKCNLSECSMNGNPIILQAEFSLICKCVKESFIDKCGEERGMEMFNHCIELSGMSEEEISEKNKEMVADDPLMGVIADAFMKFIFGGAPVALAA